MTLIRGGHHSICNCPKCLSKSSTASQLECSAPLRTAANMQLIITAAAERNKKDGEQLLKEYGLRPLQVNQT